MKKRTLPLAGRLTAGLMALAALGTGLVAQVDPATCLLRAAVAFFAGRILAGVWYALFTDVDAIKDEPEPIRTEADESGEQGAAA